MWPYVLSLEAYFLYFFTYICQEQVLCLSFSLEISHIDVSWSSICPYCRGLQKFDFARRAQDLSFFWLAVTPILVYTGEDPTST